MSEFLGLLALVWRCSLPLLLWLLAIEAHSADLTLRCSTERRVDVQPDTRTENQSFRVKMYRRESFFLVWQSSQNQLALVGRAWAGAFPMTLPCVECRSAPAGNKNNLRLSAISTTGRFELWDGVYSFVHAGRGIARAEMGLCEIVQEDQSE